MQKELIKSRFKKSLKTYNENAVVQKIMAKNLVKFLGKNLYKNIVELGCGTGFLTEEIVKNKDYFNYYAIDIVGDCGGYISKISEDINFICNDIERVKISEFCPDLVVSNAALQWSDDLFGFVDGVMGQISENGVFGFTIFGEENFKELDKIIDKKMEYFSLNFIKNKLKKYGKLTLKEEKIKLKFNSPKEVLYHIKNTGVNGVSRVSWTKKDLENFEKKYNEICGENITLTYHPIYVILEKK